MYLEELILESNSIKAKISKAKLKLKEWFKEKKEQVKELFRKIKDKVLETFRKIKNKIRLKKDIKDQYDVILLRKDDSADQIVKVVKELLDEAKKDSDEVIKVCDDALRDIEEVETKVEEIETKATKAKKIAKRVTGGIITITMILGGLYIVYEDGKEQSRKEKEEERKQKIRDEVFEKLHRQL